MKGGDSNFDLLFEKIERRKFSLLVLEKYLLLFLIAEANTHMSFSLGSTFSMFKQDITIINLTKHLHTTLSLYTNIIHILFFS